jgi:hypothetical protein
VQEIRCYQLTFRKDSTTWDQSTREIDCPDGEQMQLPPATEPPRLPDGAGPMLRDCVYARLTPSSAEARYPPHVYEQLGETSCVGSEAFSDFTRHAPHRSERD